MDGHTLEIIGYLAGLIGVKELLQHLYKRYFSKQDQKDALKVKREDDLLEFYRGLVDKMKAEHDKAIAQIKAEYAAAYAKWMEEKRELENMLRKSNDQVQELTIAAQRYKSAFDLLVMHSEGQDTNDILTKLRKFTKDGE